MNAQQMVRDLKTEAKMSQADIAIAIGSGQSYISGLERGSRGKRVGYEVGRALETLWRSRCPQAVAANGQEAA
jgi:transcriptional regulator with XRE-family HTH domain